MSTTLHHIADLLEYDQCVKVSSQNISSIRAGTYPKERLASIVSLMKAHGCGVAHTTNVDPERSSRLKTLSGKKFKVFKVDSTKDNVFHAFLHGISFIVNHHQAPRQKLAESTKTLRATVVESVLKNRNLQNAMNRDITHGYHNQFAANGGKRSFVSYSRKMRTNAFASYTELAALSRYSDVEIHIYDHTKDDFTYFMRYMPLKRTPSSQKAKKYVVRLVRSRHGSRDHFDVLIPAAFHNHQSVGFWNHVNQHVFGRRRINSSNSPEKALELLHASKENSRNEDAKNFSNLPNNNKGNVRNFSWNNSIALRK